MLQNLINLLEKYPNQLTQEQICQHLEVSPQSLQAMLDILVRKGRLETNSLQAQGTCTISCRDCPVLEHCALTNNCQETFYRVVTNT